MERACDVCGTTYEAKRKTSRYCSTKCRTRKSRGAQVLALPGTPEPPAPGVGPIEAATVSELAGVDRQATPLGLVAIALARKLDRGHMETGSGYSALAARFETMRAAALKGTSTGTAPSVLNDEVAARRAARGA